MRKITVVDILRFYVLWNDTEKKLIDGIEVSDEESFYNYLTYMKITRNFKEGSSSEVFKVSKKYKENNTEEDVLKLSTELYQANLLAKNNKNAIVASSKILWAFNHDRLIMDSINKSNLEKETTKIKNYTDFCSNWISEYNNIEPEIEELISKYNLLQIDSIFSEEWFKKRVFDLYLINLYN